MTTARSQELAGRLERALQDRVLLLLRQAPALARLAARTRLTLQVLILVRVLEPPLLLVIVRPQRQNQKSH